MKSSTELFVPFVFFVVKRSFWLRPVAALRTPVPSLQAHDRKGQIGQVNDQQAVSQHMILTQQDLDHLGALQAGQQGYGVRQIPQNSLATPGRKAARVSVNCPQT
jgi:carbamate kinase